MKRVNDLEAKYLAKIKEMEEESNQFKLKIMKLKVMVQSLGGSVIEEPERRKSNEKKRKSSKSGERKD